MLSREIVAGRWQGDQALERDGFMFQMLRGSFNRKIHRGSWDCDLNILQITTTDPSIAAQGVLN